MKKTSLFDIHVKLNAKMVPFAGFNMPVQFEGVNAEHLKVRSSVGIFDVSHMGEFLIDGENATEFLNYICSNDILLMSNGKAQYNCLINHNGGIIDDSIVYKFDSNSYMIVVNASNIDKDWDWIQEQNIKFNNKLTNISDNTSLLALQGPKANGMPELHKLTPLLSSLQDKGYAVALITDGRMSGASGKVPAAIHITPEAAADGPLSRLRDGDKITLNANTGELKVALSESELASRDRAIPPNADQYTVGRNLFSAARNQVSNAEQGASFLFNADTHFTHQTARVEVA